MTTFVVLIVAIISKTPDGAWLSIVIMAVLVPVFVSIHRHYAGVASELARERPEAERMSNTHLILLVPDLDASTAVALGYVRGIHQPGRSRCIRPSMAPQRSLGSMAAVRRRGLPLEVVTGTSLADVVKRRIASLDRSSNDLVTIVIPERISGGLATYLLRRRSFLHLKLRLLRERNVVVTDVPVHLGNGELRGRRTGADPTSDRDARVRLIGQRRVDPSGSVRDVTGIGRDSSHFELDPEEVSASRTTGSTPGCRSARHRRGSVPGPDRSILDEIRRYTKHPETIVNVVIPELIVRRPWHLFLHNQTALFVKRLLLFEERAVLTSVPFSPGYPMERSSQARVEASSPLR